MIPVSEQKVEPQSWQKQLATGLSDPAVLLHHLQLKPHELKGAYAADQLFKTRVPWCFVKRMQIGRADDPLLLQVLPRAAELTIHDGFSHDPLAEQAANPIPGLLHKYHGRVLVMPSTACAINCRYCFRRHFPYADNRLSRQQWQQIYDYIAADSSIHEIILSGGDPLVMADQTLAELITYLSRIPHINTLRLHTRLGIVLPARINHHLLNLFQDCRLRIVFVNHCNHAQEIDEQVINAMHALRDINVTVLNQSVLLKDINDNSEALSRLSHALFKAGILPYYLHQLDHTQGTAHFAVKQSHALQIYQNMQQQLPGYLVPKFVYEQASAKHKILLHA